MAEEDVFDDAADDADSGAKNLELPDIDDDPPPAEEQPDAEPPTGSQIAAAVDLPRSPAQDLEAVYDIPVQVSAVLGKSSMQVNQLLKLGRGAVVELDRKVGEAIDIYVNDRLVARGEVVVVEDRLGVTMTEIIKTEQG